MGVHEEYQEACKLRDQAVQERKDYINNNTSSISKCFQAISEAVKMINSSIDTIDACRTQATLVQSNLSLDHFNEKPWKPFQDRLHQLDEELKKQSMQRQKLINAKILKLLRGELSQPVALRLVSHLKEQTESGMIPLDSLPTIFVQCREVWISNYTVKNDPMSADTLMESFRLACFIMREAVLHTLIQYNSLFDELAPISNMLGKRIIWFCEICDKCINSIDSPSDLAEMWNELVDLNKSFAFYSCKFMFLLEKSFIQRGTMIATRSLTRSVPLFMKGLSKVSVPEGAHFKSIPVFVLLLNGFTEMFKNVLCFCPPKLLEELRSQAEELLAPLETTLKQDESDKGACLSRLYFDELKPEIYHQFNRIKEAIVQERQS